MGADDQITVGRPKNVVTVLLDANYTAMALALDSTFPTLISYDDNTTTITNFTIFCPSDEAFNSYNKFQQPPLTLLMYYIAPIKLDKQALNSSFSSSTLPIAAAKIDTLRPGHPLVVTDVDDKLDSVSINFVKIAKWGIYNDGNVMEM
ncbi:FAS1 domain [Macleaya cordata]|uniref:FAS1 domain n=1 Tax=Macleaya cordata TaxID=56857 RepID=A0A200QEJ5_MACCD|nr:FAS1 domain [Macleaya cordata]